MGGNYCTLTCGFHVRVEVFRARGSGLFSSCVSRRQTAIGLCVLSVTIVLFITKVSRIPLDNIEHDGFRVGAPVVVPRLIFSRRWISSRTTSGDFSRCVPEMSIDASVSPSSLSGENEHGPLPQQPSDRFEEKTHVEGNKFQIILILPLFSLRKVGETIREARFSSSRECRGKVRRCRDWSRGLVGGRGR